MAGLRTTLDFATKFRHANCDLWPPHIRAPFKGVRTISGWPSKRPARYATGSAALVAMTSPATERGKQRDR
jgi:hypothetical protein